VDVTCETGVTLDEQEQFRLAEGISSEVMLETLARRRLQELGVRYYSCISFY
jgi:hypothetical protein